MRDRLERQIFNNTTTAKCERVFGWGIGAVSDEGQAQGSGQGCLRVNGDTETV
jgi:hypothetical protein